MGTWPWDDPAVRRATRDRRPPDDGWPSLMKAIERMPTGQVLDPCPICLSSRTVWEHGGERGEAGPYLRCRECGFSQEETLKKNSGVGSRKLSLGRPIEQLPDDETQVLARTDDGRAMVWRANNLKIALGPRTPRHLQFPATRFIPLTEIPW